MRELLRPVRNPVYRRLFSAQVIALIGTGLSTVALALLAFDLAGEDAGGLGPARLNGLRQALAVHSGQHVLVAMHHHPLPMGSRWLDGVALRDATEFWQIIDRHPNVRAVVCGHVHQEVDRERNQVRFLSTPSTCAQFLPGNEFFALDTRPPGLRWIELFADGRIQSEVAWVTGTGSTPQ